MSAPLDPTLTHVIDISALHDHDVRIAIEANENERAAIARRLDLPALRALSGVFTIHPIRGGASLRLDLKATAERQCVVSLEPMTEEIAEAISMEFDRNFVEADDEEDATWRERLDGNEIDLGELLVQHLALSLAPYPRKPGATPVHIAVREDAPASPFAVLKSLKSSDS